MSEMGATYDVLGDIGRGRWREPVDVDEIRRFNARRRALLSRLGAHAGRVAARGLAYGGLAGLLHGLIAAPARADTALDVQILQTASSLEQLAVDTYNRALTMDVGGIATVPGTAGQVLKTFVTTTMTHHDEHKRAFQDQTRLLGGQEQTAANPRFQAVVDRTLPTLRTPVEVVDFAATLEKVATDTYLLNLTALEDSKTKEVVASVMGVEAQHLAALRIVSALLEADAAPLVKIPIGDDLANLPAVIGRVAFPDALQGASRADLVAEPASGAVR